ncbi:MULTISPECIES: IS66 family transposase zinc-finger binding domain-containing protein [Candidatus Accumulibacter]|uniref:Transposase n=1 Tax=Candidatus Accumulibacter cognatus TaxID=2954383 RepID=A0A080M7G4_9PROT|nr:MULTISPECIES: IS66 family transposase zinc-finger binding domain-containing protein [Candidatus Accumulibacter]KFB76921.1 MAG: Transposase [Candidatus Accumulibacter cognatus]HMW56010.1 IS66 family transposase zinc-finger binding domain-containing protein [Accumulibacter sp.]
MAAAERNLFDKTRATGLAACKARLNEPRQAAAMGPHQPPTEKLKRESGGRLPFPEQLPRVEHLHKPSTCPFGQCGQALEQIGEDVTEKLIVPAEFFVGRRIYPQYACLPSETLLPAPAIASVVRGGLAASAWLAWWTRGMVSKYVDHQQIRVNHYYHNDIFISDCPAFQRESAASGGLLLIDRLLGTRYSRQGRVLRTYRIPGAMPKRK